MIYCNLFNVVILETCIPFINIYKLMTLLIWVQLKYLWKNDIFFFLLAELGDYNQSENLPGYLSDYSFIPNQPQDFEKEIAKLHQQHM